MSKRLEWPTSVKVGSVNVEAFERPDRRDAVYVRYNPKGSTHRVKRRLRLTVRDERGKLDPARVRAAVSELHRIGAELELGRDPFADGSDTGSLTIARGFALALDPGTGMYVTRARHEKDVERAGKTLVRILGAGATMEHALSPRTFRVIVRQLANEFVKSDGTSMGGRGVEQVVDSLYVVGAWLNKNEYLPDGAYRRVPGWRSDLRAVWKKMTGQDIRPDPKKKPRHTPAELKKLFGALDNPMRKLFEVLAWTIARSKLVAVRRSDVTIRADGITISVRKSGKKKCEAVQVVALLPAQAAAMSALLATDLRDLEAAYQAGTRADYFLFPARDPGANPPTIDGGRPAGFDRNSLLAVDERFALAFEIGGEQRLGQVLRTMRSQLEIPGVDPSANEFTPPFGVLEPPSSGKKVAQPIALTEAQRDWLMVTMSHGYLRLLEAAYQRQAIKDYPLFPAGRLRDGMPKPSKRLAPLCRDGALKMFRQLERAAGVTEIPGRGWYGVRRVASDLVEDAVRDVRVQDAVLANSRETRAEHYLERHRPALLMKASDVREAVRGRAPADPPRTPEIVKVLRALEERGIHLDLAGLKNLLESHAASPTEGDPD